MGQKTHPYGFRLGAVKPWRSRWYAQGKEFPKLLAEDEKLRKYLQARLGHAAIAQVEIERKPSKIVVTIHTGRPGVVIGKRGAEVDKLRDELALLTDAEVSVNVEEIRRPETQAQLVADNVAHQLTQRISFRRAMKRAVQAAMRAGAGGIRIQCGGRLGGAEIARSEGYHEGRVPLHTLRADIDYAERQARTTFGTIGVKVWIFTARSWKTAAVRRTRQAGAAAVRAAGEDRDTCFSRSGSSTGNSRRGACAAPRIAGTRSRSATTRFRPWSRAGSRTVRSKPLESR